MNISRFEPWNLVNILQRDLDHMAGRRLGISGGEDSGQSVTDWVPAVDIIEEKDRFLLRADVPGVNAEDIDVSMENGILTVSGHRHEESTEESEGVKRLERISGKFYRRFSLPDTANAEDISAKSMNGILEVVIPKQAQIRSRRIAVEAA